MLSIRSTADMARALASPIDADLKRLLCQTAFKRDPRSASKRDPLFG